jgi:hypothetical protein
MGKKEKEIVIMMKFSIPTLKSMKKLINWSIRVKFDIFGFIFIIVIIKIEKFYKN